MTDALMSVVWTIVFCLAIGGLLMGVAQARFWYVKWKATREIDQVIQRGGRR